MEDKSLIPLVKDTIVAMLLGDNFRDETYKMEANVLHWNRLEELKGKVFDFYTQNVSQTDKVEPFYNLHTRFYLLNIQLKRLRLVIQPEFHIIKNVHPISKIPYYSVRGYWIDLNDKKVKIFTKSLGRADKYVGGKNDPNLIKEATIKIQDLSYSLYKKEYE